MSEIERARRVLEDACVMTSFPPPTVDQGLARWADEVLDIPLAPRGSPIWTMGHAHTIAALEAALRYTHGDELAQIAVQEHVRNARQVVVDYGRMICACETPGATFFDVVDRRRCVKCLGRI